MNMIEFDKWPTDLFFLLRELLTSLEYHRFMNTSQELFQSIRKKTIVFKLGFRRSANFVLDEDWKGDLISKVALPDNQIELSFFIRTCAALSDFRWYLSSLPLFTNFSDLDDEEYPFHSNLRRVTFATMSYFQFRYNLSRNKVETVISFPFPGVEEISQIPKIQFSKSCAFGGFFPNYLKSCCHLKKVTITSVSFSSFNCLSRCDSLELSSCWQLIDVSQLGNIRVLLIKESHQLKDIRNLTNNNRIGFFSCTRIKNYDSLSKAAIIQLTDQNNVEPAVFRQVRQLDLINCRFTKNCRFNSESVRFLRVKDPPVDFFQQNDFHRCRAVVVSQYKRKLDLTIFKNVNSLTLQYCMKLTSLSRLVGNNHTELTIRYCEKITGFSPLAQIPHVIIELHLSYNRKLVTQSTQFTTFEGLQNIRTLEIGNMMRDEVDFTPLFAGENEKLVIFGACRISNWDEVNLHYVEQQSKDSPIFLKR
jgi:hypothetical protein